MKRNKPEDVFRFIDMRNGDTTQCWPWMGTTHESKGDTRPYFSLAGKRVTAYRLAYELYTGKTLDARVFLLHSCDNSICCNPHHLREGNHEQNMEDMKSRQRHGLPHNVVRAIKRLLDAGREQQHIADLYGISRELVSAIHNDRVYKHVKPEDIPPNSSEGADNE